MQDEKKGKARLYHGPIFWNYGCLPQTWEDPNVKGDADVGGAFGDDDPIDVVEIGASSQDMGAIVPVKPLGVLSMIDDGEVRTLPLHTPLHTSAHADAGTAAAHTRPRAPRPTDSTRTEHADRSRAFGRLHGPWDPTLTQSRPLFDEGNPPPTAPRTWQLDWKVIAIAGSDKHAKDINDVGDIEKYYPGTVSGIREWFRWYKTPDGALAPPPASPDTALGGREEGRKASGSHAHSSALHSGAGLLCTCLAFSPRASLTLAASLGPPCPHPCRPLARRQADQRLWPQGGGAQRGQGGRGHQGDQRVLPQPDGRQDRRGQALSQVECVSL